MTFFNMTVSNLKRHVTLLEVSIFLSKLPNVCFQVEDYKMNLLKEPECAFSCSESSARLKGFEQNLQSQIFRSGLQIFCFKLGSCGCFSNWFRDFFMQSLPVTCMFQSSLLLKLFEQNWQRKPEFSPANKNSIA